MIVLEVKLRGSEAQFRLLDEAIRAAQFVRNKALRYWLDNQKTNRNTLQKMCAVWRKEFEWCKKLSAQACQASADRAWAAISRFYENCRLSKPGKKGFPKFKKNTRSVEYKVDGWKLSNDRRVITFRDGFKAGDFQLIGTRDLHFYQLEQIKRVRIVRRADGYYCQFCVEYDRKEEHQWTGRVVGIDMGLEFFYTDSDGNTVANPRFLRKSEKALKRAQRQLSRKKKGSKNARAARNKVGRKHLLVSRQRRDWACKQAQALVKSADLIVYEHLQLRNLVKNHKVAKSISDAAWSEFLRWVEYFAKIHGIVTVVVPPHYTTLDCSYCGTRVQKTLSTRTHECVKCGVKLHRDYNAAKVILSKGLEFLGKSREAIQKILWGAQELTPGEIEPLAFLEQSEMLSSVNEPGIFSSDTKNPASF